MTRLAASALCLALLGAGCATSGEPVALVVSEGDTLVVRQTVLGFGGKLAELVGASPEAREVIVPGTWPDAFSSYGEDAFVLLPRATYAELLETGSTHVSLGLLDEAVSDALGWIERLNALADLVVGAGEGNEGEAEDVLRVDLTNASASDWVRVDGTLTLVKTIEASNRFARYVILASPDAPLILSLTLTPAARAELSVLSSFEGFEVAEIRTKDLLIK